MVLNNQLYSDVSGYIFALFICAVVSLLWLFFGRNRASEYFKILANLGDKNDSNTTVEKKREKEEEVCTSLNCIRCSKSVFSPEKLLRKWNKIEEDFQPDQNIGERIRNGILNTSKRLEDDSQNGGSQQEPTLFKLEGLASQIWYTRKDLSSEVTILEKQNTLDIFLKEFVNVYQDLDKGWVSNKVPSGGWHLFYLINQGVKIEENCLKCPKVMEVVNNLKLAMVDCAFGNVMFSVLLPGTSIGRHCGPTNVRIRCHVPLRAPRGYFISVAGEEQSWQQGKVLIFDDSFYHEVYCRGDQDEARVVLMIDLWHPSLSLMQREIIRSLFSPQS